ncbi:RadC family protein [Pararoseomonas baculiformis]|uniref:RadC family protein n=1 Tax=Pararoseomonas baculiformis TaxID=2820812 RepID=UPI001FD865B2|nr:DNA repair protein RadC [Pararoseomonas baculiformis]
MARKPGLEEASPGFAALLDLPAGQPSSRPASSAPPTPTPGPEGHRRRLRDRLLRAGPAALADYELLEMLLFLALPRVDTKPHAKRLLARFGSYARTISATDAELRGVEGIGEAAIAALRLVQASALRLLAEEVRDQPVLNNWERLIGYLSAALAREGVEQFRILFLDTRNRLLADEAQARGTVNHTPVYPREVIRRALDLGATALILVHNHPSGDPNPSRADIEMTTEIRQAAATLGIVVHDHLIIGNGRHFSFRREGLL